MQGPLRWPLLVWMGLQTRFKINLIFTKKITKSARTTKILPTIKLCSLCVFPFLRSLSEGTDVLAKHFSYTTAGRKLKSLHFFKLTYCRKQPGFIKRKRLVQLATRRNLIIVV